MFHSFARERPARATGDRRDGRRELGRRGATTVDSPHGFEPGGPVLEAESNPALDRQVVV